MVNVGKYTIHGSYGCLLLYRISGEKKSWPKKYVGYPVAYTNPSEVTAGVSLNFARQWGRHHAIDFGRKRKGWFRLNICCTAWNLWVCPLFRSVPKISKKDQIPIKTRVTSSCSYRYIWCDPYGKSCLFQVPSCLFYHASFRSPGSNWGGRHLRSDEPSLHWPTSISPHQSTLTETNSKRHLKMDGWNFLLGPGLFSGAKMLVSGRVPSFVGFSQAHCGASHGIHMLYQLLPDRYENSLPDLPQTDSHGTKGIFTCMKTIKINPSCR